MTSIERSGTNGRSEQNLSLGERAVYVAAGLGLAALGAKPRPNPLLNVLALAGGAYLAWSGYEGRCVVKEAFRQPS
jgi:threonine/homoserine/homoserine lactone efflux protein